MSRFTEDEITAIDSLARARKRRVLGDTDRQIIAAWAIRAGLADYRRGAGVVLTAAGRAAVAA